MNTYSIRMARKPNTREKKETKNVLEHRMKSYKTAQQKYSLRRATEKTKTQESRQNHEQNNKKSIKEGEEDVCE